MTIKFSNMEVISDHNSADKRLTGVGSAHERGGIGDNE